MKTRLALLATGVFLAACSDNSTEPKIDPSYYAAEDHGAPAGRGNCHPLQLKDAQQGRITPGSCNYNDTLGRRSQYYVTNTPAANQQLALRWTGDFAPVLGVKVDTENPNAGMVHTAFSWDIGDAVGVNFIGASATQQVFVSNRDANALGSFELTSAVEPVSYSCDYPTIYEAPVAFNTTIDPAHACATRIRFPANNPYLGRPLLSQFYYGKLIAGKTYNIRMEGVGPAFDAALSLYRPTTTGWAPVRQNIFSAPVNGVRALQSFTPATTGTFIVEVASGRPDGQGGWLLPAGSFRLVIEVIN